MCSSTALIAIVFAVSLQLPLQAHDIYSHLKDKSGASCCDDGIANLLRTGSP